MKIYSDDKIIQRNGRVSFGAALMSPILIAISAWLFFNNPEQLGISLGLFVLGFLMYQVGIATKRWSQGTDLKLNKALKKLDNNYSIYHFTTPASHLLVGPAGIWILIPKYVRGTIVYNERRKRWKLKRNTVGTKVFGVFLENLGRPDVDLIGEADALDRYLTKHWKHAENPHIDAVLVMMDERVEIETEGAPIETVKIGKLREFIRDQEKNSKVSTSLVRKFNTFFSTD